MIARPELVDFVAFASAILKDESRRPLRLAAPHLSWILHIGYCWERELGALINAPMGHGKTTLFSVGFPLYLLGQDTNRRIKLISATDPLAADRVAGVRDYIDGDADFRTACSHVRPSMLDRVQARRGWARHKLHLHRTGRSIEASLEARGILSTGVGGRCEYVGFDDPVDERNAASEVMRKRVIDAFDKLWMTRLEPWGRWWMISTPWHQDDLNHHLRRKPTVCTLIERVSDDYAHLDFEIVNAVDDRHPLMRWRAAA